MTKPTIIFSTVLYQEAVAALPRGDIAIPLRDIFRGKDHIRMIMDEAEIVSCQQHIVRLTEECIRFDYPVMAPDSHMSLFGHPEWNRHICGLKTLHDATHIRDQRIHSFEKAERLRAKANAISTLPSLLWGEDQQAWNWLVP